MENEKYTIIIQVILNIYTYIEESTRATTKKNIYIYL